MNVNELIERSHAMARDKGWWPCSVEHPGMATLAEIEKWERMAVAERSVAEMVNNFHAEISEAWEEWRAGRMETWFLGHYSGERILLTTQLPREGEKPEGFWVEIADLAIRLADTMGAMGWTFGSEAASMETRPEYLLFNLHTAVSDMATTDLTEVKWHRHAGIQAAWAIRACITAAKSHGVDLLALCELKMAYNATRPHRHGGKKA